MFDSLSEKIDLAVRKLRGVATIRAENVEEVVRDVRLALLEADVHFEVARDFTERVRTEALGQDVLRSLSPAQQFLKIVDAELTRLMGASAASLDLGFTPPVTILLVGLQGSGKTTSVAKLAYWLRAQHRRKPYLVPADVYRPAAIEQLTALARQIDVPVHPTTPDADPVTLAREARAAALSQGCDVVILDTAGRLQIDERLMDELVRMKEAARPDHVLLAVDAMTGQDAVNVARGFHERLSVSGVILTKMDGDARGGAALSVRAVTGAPILFSGIGEKPDALEVFHPDRMARRILGMGDMLTLIEKAEREYDEEKAKALEKKLRRNEFTIGDFREQLRAVRRMGPVTELIGMIPGMKKMARGGDLSGAEKEFKRIEAIIDSMTRQERDNHLLLNGSRRRRIALGSGTSVAEVNRFLKQFEQTRKMMKQMTKMMGRGGMPRGLSF